MHRPLVLFALACATLHASSAHAKLKVVASTAPLGAIAREVGGADVTVAVLAAASEDPHFVEPKPSLILHLNQADLLIVNGVDLEIGWLPKLIVQARNQKLTAAEHVVDAARSVVLLDVPTGKVDRTMGDVHAGGNPHFLLDPRRGAQLALALAERMAALDPPAAAGYRARAHTLVIALQALASKASERALRIAPEQRRVVAYHRSLTYLVEWLALEQVATVEPKPGVPPDPGHTATVLQAMRAMKVRVLLQEEFYPKSTSRTLAQLSGAQLVTIAGGPRPEQTYAQWLTQTAEGVLHALGG